MTPTNSPRHPKRGGLAAERGGFAVGLIVGLLVGLTLALGVALYVTKVPVPFINKVPQRTAGQDAAEIEKNKNWDANGPLYGKNPARPNGANGGAVAPAPGSKSLPATPPALKSDDTAAALPVPEPSGAAAEKPLPAPKITSTVPAGADPFTYFVQAGAYSRTEDAEQQRARLAMLGMESRITDREQAGRTVYRVRVGPFSKKSDADNAKAKLSSENVEASLVRVQR
ncbi:MAG: SPOR domain-containing protein [Burkholderiaceae bacterium]